MPSQLVNETSPHPLQHTEPVKWFPWWEKAFAEAREPVAAPAGVGHYELFRSTGQHCSTNDQRIFTGAGTTMHDRDLAPEVLYRYCARTVDAARVVSLLSEPASVSFADERRPPAPRLSAAADGTDITVTWDPVDTPAGVDHYELFRSITSDCIDTDGPISSGPETVYVDRGLEPGTPYRYRARRPV